MNQVDHKFMIIKFKYNFLRCPSSYGVPKFNVFMVIKLIDHTDLEQFDCLYMLFCSVIHSFFIHSFSYFEIKLGQCYGTTFLKRL